MVQDSFTTAADPRPGPDRPGDRRCSSRSAASCIRRWRAAEGPERAALTPMIWAGRRDARGRGGADRGRAPRTRTESEQIFFFAALAGDGGRALRLPRRPAAQPDGGARARERSPRRRSPRPCRGAARLACAHRPGQRHRAPPPRARPARRRAAAARRAGARPEARAREARHGPRRGRRAARREHRGARRGHRASCASWRAASTPRCSPTAASGPPSRRSPAARRSRSRSRRCRRCACRDRSSRRRTSWSPRRSRTCPSTRTPRTPR